MAIETQETSAAERPLPAQIEVAIIGSGFGGLAAATALSKAGRSFVILERANDLGGTWRDNTYPGCACDVPSRLYSFSFALNPDWSRSFSGQPEIFEYLKATARRDGIEEKIVFNAEVTDSRWDETRQVWITSSSKGEIEARFLVVAAGGLSEPRVPALPGLESFRGATFHSAQWDHDYELAGKRVAVVGTGASAIQFVPHLQREAEHLTVFQRTAPWVLPRRDRAIGRFERAVYRRLPFTQRVVRSLIYWGRETWVLAFRKPKIMSAPEKQARSFIEKQVSDPELRAKVTPNYTLGCKRVLLSNDYYPAIDQPNVDLVSDRIIEVQNNGIVTESSDGTRSLHELDAIIFGTGFKVTDHPIATRITGRSGQRLRDAWQGGMSALYGTTVAGFPNMFFLLGPNTGLGHNSVVLMMEAQIKHMIQVIDGLKAAGATAVEPRREVQDAYNDALQRSLKGTVWNAGGCASYYLDPAGRNTTLWPSFSFSFMNRLRRADPADYQTFAPVSAESEHNSLERVNA